MAFPVTNPAMLANSAEAMIKALEARVAALEAALQVSATQVTLQSGAAQMILKRGGEVEIRSTRSTFSSMGTMSLKAAGDLILKGSTIKQN